MFCSPLARVWRLLTAPAEDYSIPDPELTEEGHAQLQPLRESLMKHPLAQNAGLIVASPMVRTLQTAMGSLDWLVDKGVKMEADADWQGGFLVPLSGPGERGEAAKALKGPTARTCRSTADFIRLYWLSFFLLSFIPLLPFSLPSHCPFHTLAITLVPSTLRRRSVQT